MKKIALSLATIAAVCVLAIGATGAYFTSNSATAADTVTAGTLNVNAAVGGSWNTSTVNISHLAPGEITGEATYTVKNTGNLDAATFARFTLAGDMYLAGALNIYNYKVEYFRADGSPANRWSSHDPYFGETKNVDWFIKDGNTSKWTSVGGNPNLLGWVNGAGPLDVYIPGPTAWDMEGLPAGAYYIVHVQFQMDPIADNTYQGRSVAIGYEAKATQLTDAAINAFGYPGYYTYLGPNADTYR